MKLRLPKWMLESSAKMYLSSKPLWFQWNPAHHKVSGTETRQIINSMQAGDILLRTFHGYVNSMFSGVYGHAAMVLSKEKIIHAVSEGVVIEDILDFTRCDSICLLRVKDITNTMIVTAINSAKDMLNSSIQYDYGFETRVEELKNNEPLEVYCSEGVHMWHNNLFIDDYKMIAGNNFITPDSIRSSNKIKMILEFTHKKGKRN